MALRLCFYDSEGRRSAARFLPVSAALVPVDDDGYMVNTDRIVTVHEFAGRDATLDEFNGSEALFLKLRPLEAAQPRPHYHVRYFQPTTHTVENETMTFRPVLAYGVPGKQNYIDRLGVDPHKLWLPSGNLPMDPSAVAADFFVAPPEEALVEDEDHAVVFAIRTEDGVYHNVGGPALEEPPADAD
ncbi:MAG: hypothetical protein CL902_00475 [Dehalococcoidia bacterium]|mgnify:CR=1 FL=1|nr:hypothetical protein [Dehalococcoidia bacterium]